MSGKEANICSDNKQNWGGGGAKPKKRLHTHAPTHNTFFRCKKLGLVRKASQLVHCEFCAFRGTFSQANLVE